MGERTRYQPGRFCWAGLATSHPAAAGALHTSLFDWEAEPLPAGAAGAYTIMRPAGHNIAICYRQTAQARAAGRRRIGPPTPRSRAPTRPQGATFTVYEGQPTPS